MIGARDRITLPDDVVLRESELHDVVRLAPVPLNATARVVLGAPTPRDAAAALERRHAIDAEAALGDVLAFCAELNARFLLNVSVRGGGAAVVARWLRTAPFLLPLGVVPTLPVTRHRVDTTSLRTLARTGPPAFASVEASLFLGGAVASALLLVVTGYAAPTIAVVVGAAIALSVALHELAHLAALRGVPSCVVTRGLRVAVVHRAVSRSRARTVAAAGPLAGLAVSASLLACLAQLPSAELASATFVSLLNALGLTVLSRDGRTLCGLR